MPVRIEYREVRIEHALAETSAFQEELARLQRESGGTKARLTDQLSTVKRKLDSVVRAIENGAWNDTLKQRLNDLEAQQKSLQTQLDASAKPEPAVILHPNAAELYATKVANLQSALNQADARAEAIDVLRLLIERIVLTPDAEAPDGLAVELHGDLATILSLAASPVAVSVQRARKTAASAGAAAESLKSGFVPGGILSVVAGVGFEPTTFRL